MKSGGCRPRDCTLLYARAACSSARLTCHMCVSGPPSSQPPGRPCCPTRCNGNSGPHMRPALLLMAPSAVAYTASISGLCSAQWCTAHNSHPHITDAQEIVAAKSTNGCAQGPAAHVPQVRECPSFQSDNSQPITKPAKNGGCCARVCTLLYALAALLTCRMCVRGPPSSLTTASLSQNE